MSGTPPVNDYSSLMELAGRIHRHLATNPRDTQALDDLHYVAGLLKGGATQAANTQEMAQAVGPQTEHPGAAITSGLTEAALDLPKGILQMVMHPVQTAGQLTGVGNMGQAWRTLHDPEADWAEKADAIARATPLNMGYAAERGLLNATGAKSDTPASLQDQAHAAGNVASLALLGVNRNTPGVALAGRVIGKIPVVGPMLRAGREALQRAGPQESPQALIQREMRAAAPPQSPVPLDALRAMRDFEAGKISGEDLRVAMDQAAGRALEPQGLLAPRLTPMPGQPRGLLGPEGPSPAPKAAYPPSLSEMQGMRTAPLPEPWQNTTPQAGGVGGHSYSGTYPVPDVPPTVVNAAPAAAAIRKLPYAQLTEALRAPETPKVLKDLILAEIQRRGITGPGLLAPR